MLSVAELLSELQQRISEKNNPHWQDDRTEKLYFAQSQGLFHVEYYGSSFDETYDCFLQTLCNSDVAGQLRSLAIRGPDEGANGTRNWNLTKLVESGVEFPYLNTFFVELTAPEHHNQTIIGQDYEEEGQIGHLLAKMPRLQSLTVPSAPDACFFQVGLRPSRFLRVESGYSHQNFIFHLSKSSCFPELATLDFGDFSQRYMDNYWEQCTPFSDYKDLFQSPAFQHVRRFNLRNSVLTTEQLMELRQLQQEVQFFVIQSHGEYLR